MQLAIMGLANDLVYADRLVCGAPEVACRALLAAPPGAALAGWLGAAGPVKRGVGRWMAEALSPARPVVLLDTAAVSVRAGAGAGAAEGGAGAGAGGGQRSGEGCTMNSAEALAAALLADALARCGVAQGAIGVISPYRAQAPNPYPLPSAHYNCRGGEGEYGMGNGREGGAGGSSPPLSVPSAEKRRARWRPLRPPCGVTPPCGGRSRAL